MELNANGHRFNEYHLWEDIKYKSYDYAREGLLKHIMSPVIVNTTNNALKILLQYIESSLIFVMKYTDMLKNFKNIHWRNR
jgi:hypothetical protein